MNEVHYCMAQILKKEKEELILKISKDLFIKKGYSETSMKDIAKASSISVGNLYHYYANKNSIAFSLTKNLFEQIDVYIQKYTNDEISLFSKRFTFTKNDIIKPKQISKVILDLIKHLVDLYETYSDDFILVNTCPDIIAYLKDWLGSLVIYFIESKYKIANIYNDEIVALVPSYTNAIIEGAINIFTNKHLSLKKKKRVLSIYFNSYVSMLDINNIMVR